MAEPLLNVCDLSFQLDGLPILKDFSMQAKPGEIVAIIGPSGCGKTVFLKLLAGILPAPINAFRWNSQGRKPEIAVAFQHAPLFPWLSLHENLTICMNGPQRRAGEKQALALE